MEVVCTIDFMTIRHKDKGYFMGFDYFDIHHKPRFSRHIHILMKGYYDEAKAKRDLEMLKALGYDCEIVYP